MAEQSTRIDTATGRAKLKPRREPYWSRILAGAFVGFRKATEGEGTWIARWRDQEGKQNYYALGHQEDYDAAVKAARAWFQQCEGATPKTITVADACKQYVKNRRVNKGAQCAQDAEGRFKRHVFAATLGKIELSKLKKADIETWQHGLVRTSEDDDDAERRSKDSANRDLNTLKAALNLAFENGLVASDASWRRVSAFEQVSKRRDRFLTLVQRKRLFAAASPELKRLIRAIALTGARPGELQAVKVSDLDRSAGTLILSGKTGTRAIPLSPAATAFFKECAGKREGTEPLVARADGTAWHRFAWRDSIREAVTKAKLPADVVLYSIRHAAISEMIVAGLDVMSVARLAGTSVAMISKHYGHLVQDHVRPILATVKAV